MDNTTLLNWAVEQWNKQVLNRPLINIHRRSLDDVWRQVIKKFGGNDLELIGPHHDELLAAQRYEEGSTPEEAPISVSQCDAEIFMFGTSVGFFDMSKEEANQHCQNLTKATGRKHDWHYFGGRVHIKSLPFSRPLVNIALVNLNQFLSKTAQFENEVDRQASLNCLDVIRGAVLPMSSHEQDTIYFWREHIFPGLKGDEKKRSSLTRTACYYLLPTEVLQAQLDNGETVGEWLSDGLTLTKPESESTRHKLGASYALAAYSVLTQTAN